MRASYDRMEASLAEKCRAVAKSHYKSWCYDIVFLVLLKWRLCLRQHVASLSTEIRAH